VGAVLAVSPGTAGSVSDFAGSVSDVAALEAPARVPLKVTIDKDSVDLDKHRLELRMSRPAGHVSIQVFAASGEVLAEDDIDFSGRPANARLVVTWKPKSDEPVARIELYAHDAEGYYQGVAIVPWSLEIPHEEVTFETNSAVIRPEEEPKLEQSLRLIEAAFEKHKDLGNVALFIAGHTDTRGSAEHNRQLSRQRAQAIARWFRAHGLKMPIAFEGFGEHAPKVKTEDEVDEPQNRRVDYVLSVEAPRLKSSSVAASWKKL
jgi:outer membrane protein OmpA-like peptidoglycan-associated protein